jgi:hypothetical protein
MEEPTKVDQLAAHVKEYAEERINLIVLNLHDKVSRILSGAVSFIILLIFGVFTILFLSLGLAWWIGQEMQKPFMGFLLVGGFYFILILLIGLNRKSWIGTPVINAFLKNVSDE